MIHKCKKYKNYVCEQEEKFTRVYEHYEFFQ